MQLIKVDLARWRPLAIFDQPVPSFFEPIRAYLSRHLSADELRLLAYPVRFGEAYSWFTDRTEPVAALAELSERERDAAQQAFFATVRRIDTIISHLHAETPDQRSAGHSVLGRSLDVGDAGRFAALLARLNLTPDRRFLFVQSGVPIRVAWGGKSETADLFDDPALRAPIQREKSPAPTRTWLRYFGRTRSSEVALDSGAAGALLQEADTRMAAREVFVSRANRVTLMWENANDLDLALIAPDGGLVNFVSRRIDIGGVRAELDVDMNASDRGDGFDRRAPVENISLDRFAVDGMWQVLVTHYRHRTPAPLSCRFRVALQFDGRIRLFEGQLAAGDRHVVATFGTQDGKVLFVEGIG